MTDEAASRRRAQLERFATGFAAVADALDGASDEDLDRRGPSGGWSAREVAHHLADSESMAYVRLRRLIAEDDPVIAGYDEPEWASRLHYERPIETSIEVLQAVRGASQQLLMALTAGEWERRGTHSESGEYSVDHWLDIYSAHSHDHADQIRRARRGED
jgi:DinB superfamily